MNNKSVVDASALHLELTDINKYGLITTFFKRRVSIIL